MSFCVLEIFTSLYYANKESDDVIGGPLKTVQHSNKNIFKSVKPVFFKLDTRNEHHKKQNDTCHAVAMTTVVSLILFYL